jgi:hypothetical protein
VKALEAFLLDQVTPHRASLDVSSVKSDGTVFVKLRSTANGSSMELMKSLERAFCGHGIQSTKVTDNQVRLSIEQEFFAGK